MDRESQTFARKMIFRTRFRLSATHLLIGGLLIVPSFLFDPSLILRYAQTLLFIALAAVVGRRILVWPNVVMILGIVAANLVSPLGRVLVRIGPVPITFGALKDGLMKASLLIGLIYLSRFSVRDDLVLPGRFGSLVAKVFRYFGLITERRGALSRHDSEATAVPERGRRRFERAADRLVERLDTMLLSLQFDESARVPAEPVATELSGLGLLSFVVIMNWVLVIVLAPALPA